LTPPEADSDTQARLNASFWARGEQVDEYANRELRPVEAMLLDRYREALAGRVLELGCGAGRLTGFLCEISDGVHGLDISPAMVAYCQSAFPNASFSVRDLRDLDGFEDASFEVVFAPFNVLDVLGDDERRAELVAIRRIISPAGLLILSSHNRAYAPLIAKPTQLSFASKRELLESVIYMPRRVRNRRRLRPLQQNQADFAILNDDAHDFSILHYYIGRDAQERQLGEAGYELLGCFDLDGAEVLAGQDAATCAELHYVASRS